MVKDKVGRLPGELGVSRSVKCDTFSVRKIAKLLTMT